MEEKPPQGTASISGAFSIGRSARATQEHVVEALEIAEEGGIDADSLWAAMRRCASAVTVVTSRNDEGYLGITVSAFCMVSLQPPLVLVCINEDSQLIEAITSSSAFGVTILSSRQELLADMFAGRGPRPEPSFSSIKHHVHLTGAPILDSGLAWLDCRLHETYVGGDHSIFIGRVVAAGVAADQSDPLLYFGSQYRRLAP